MVRRRRQDHEPSRYTNFSEEYSAERRPDMLEEIVSPNKALDNSGARMGWSRRRKEYGAVLGMSLAIILSICCLPVAYGQGDITARQEKEIKELVHLQKVLQIEEDTVDRLEDMRMGNRGRIHSLGDASNHTAGENKPAWGRFAKATHDCSDVDLLSTEEDPYGACEQVKGVCRPPSGLYNYLEISYCLIPTYRWLSGVFLLTWICLLFIWLTAMVDFLVPSLATMADACCLKQSVAGVTFLALGNGSSDIFSMMAATVSGPRGMELALGEVLGNGMFVFAFIQGLIAVLSPFTVVPAEYIRDCTFYISAILLVIYVMYDGIFTLWEGLLFLCLYATYITVVVCFEQIMSALGLHDAQREAEEKEQEKEQQSLLTSDRFAVYASRLDNKNPSHAQQVADFLNPIPADLEYLPVADKVLEVIKIPVVLLLKITVPVVDRGLPLNGWSRPVTCVQLAMLPVIVTLFVYMHPLNEWFLRQDVFLTFVGGSITLGLVMASGLYLSTQDEVPPRMHSVLAFLGFGVAVIFIYATSEEIVNVILSFGVVFDVGRTVLGITILAIGIGMQDLVTNVGVAKAGLARMAAVACVGSPLLNMLMGLGLSSIAGNAFVSSPYPLLMTFQIQVCLVFLLVSVLLALVVLLSQGFRGGALFGVTMIYDGVVAVTLTFTVLVGEDEKTEEPNKSANE